MKIIAKIILALIANILALIIIGYAVPEIVIAGDPKGLLLLAALLTFANLIIRPIIKIILSPLILITFGLFTFIINAGILYLVDIYAPEITISGLLPLILATLILSVINMTLRFVAKVL